MARRVQCSIAMHIPGAVAAVVMSTSVAMADAPGVVPPPAIKVSPYDSDPPNRITGTVDASGGLSTTLGGSLAYERRVYHNVGLLVRVGYAKAYLSTELDGCCDAAQIGYTNIGVRYYGARAYVHTELGVSVIRRGGGTDDNGEYHPTTYKTWPSFAAGFGGKPTGAIDIGISAVFPQLGAQIHFGVDFSQF